MSLHLAVNNDKRKCPTGCDIELRFNNTEWIYSGGAFEECEDKVLEVPMFSSDIVSIPVQKLHTNINVSILLTYLS